mgnify:CR=1 FL=1
MRAARCLLLATVLALPVAARADEVTDQLDQARQFYQDGDITHCNMPMENPSLLRMWQELEAKACVAARTQAIQRFNEEEFDVVVTERHQTFLQAILLTIEPNSSLRRPHEDRTGLADEPARRSATVGLRGL